MQNTIMIWLCYEAVCIRPYIILISSDVLLEFCKRGLSVREVALSVFHKVVEVKQTTLSSASDHSYYTFKRCLFYVFFDLINNFVEFCCALRIIILHFFM